MIPSRWRAYRPPTVDVVMAAVFVAAGQATVWWPTRWGADEASAFAGPRPLNAVISVLFLSALAWRRRAPLAAVCWGVAVYCLPHLLVPLDVTFLTGFIPLVILVATAGYSGSRRRAVAAAAIGMVGLAAVSVSTELLRSWDSFAPNTMFLLVPWIGARALREREDRAARLAAELAAERASTQAALEQGAAAERAHIARELHDVVAHNVSMMVIQVGAARMQLEASSAAAASLLDAEDAGRQTLEDLRRLLGVLRTDEPDGDEQAGPEPPQPGLSQLEALVVPVREAGLDVAVDITGEPVPLPAALDLTAFRIVQEALTNTLKHSRATRATVRLDYSASTLHIDVVDDGTVAPADERSGHGLIGMRERASLFGGAVSAGANPEGGWRTRAELPLPGRAAHGEPSGLPRATLPAP